MVWEKMSYQEFLFYSMQIVVTKTCFLKWRLFKKNFLDNIIFLAKQKIGPFIETRVFLLSHSVFAVGFWAWQLVSKNKKTFFVNILMNHFSMFLNLVWFCNKGCKFDSLFHIFTIKKKLQFCNSWKTAYACFIMHDAWCQQRFGEPYGTSQFTFFRGHSHRNHPYIFSFKKNKRTSIRRNLKIRKRVGYKSWHQRKSPGNILVLLAPAYVNRDKALRN